jgi:hypothetical protein
MHRKQYRPYIHVVVASVLLTVMGCAGLRITADYGMIIPDAEATAAFDRYELNPNFNYYFSGPELYPNALIGLDSNYTLEPDLWKKVDFTPQTFRSLIKDMQSRAARLYEFQHGFAILDDKGHPIGVWYSLLAVQTWVKMAGDRTVVIGTPEMGVYEKRERDEFGITPMRH